jgi:phosphoribosyl 1,2-cyclic phosphodiesterase
MGVSLTVLSSGSKGNSSVVVSTQTRLLVDCGLSCRELCRRMMMNGMAPESIDAILITHEHSDHVGGLYVMAKKFNLPVYISAPTHAAWRRYYKDSAGNKVSAERVEFFEPGRGFIVGDIEVMPFTIPHDAADPVGFTFKTEGIKVGIATDLGYMPASVKDHIKGCDALMIESNHDLEMLRQGPYPWSVKQRVLSRVGHLSNTALADFFTNDYDGGAAFLILAHLSEQNNHPEIARKVAESALGDRNSLFQMSQVMLATQTEVLQTVTL